MLRVAAKERLCVVCLRPSIVSIPCELRVGVTGIVEGLVVVVGALQRFPVLESLPALRWNIVAAAVAIYVPLPLRGMEVC